MTSLRERLLGRTGVEIILDGDDGISKGSVIVTKKENGAHIGYIGVKSDERGRGYGSKLLTEAESWAVRNGSTEITGKLIPVPGSERSVINLIESHGYQVDEKGNIVKKL